MIRCTLFFSRLLTRKSLLESNIYSYKDAKNTLRHCISTGCPSCCEHLPQVIPGERGVVEAPLKRPIQRGGSREHDIGLAADRVPVLQRLIDVGMHIYELDKNPQLAKRVLLMDYDRDVVPYLNFLRGMDIPESDLGKILTKNPALLVQDLDDLDVRLNYFESKRFDRDMVRRIVMFSPSCLSMTVLEIDKRLGQLQILIRLTGDEVRQMVMKYPSVLTMKWRNVVPNYETLRRYFDLDTVGVKEVLLNQPRILKIFNDDLTDTITYLAEDMTIPKELILQQPLSLFWRRHLIQRRHEFLSHLNRAQYDPKLPGYVSLMDLLCASEEHFAKAVARCSLQTFYDFQKMDNFWPSKK